MNAPFYKRVEIAFWDFAIQAMSENDRVRVAIQQAYRFAHDGEIRRMARWMAFSAAAGLVSGFCLYLLTAAFGH